MNIFNMLQVYAGKWSVKETRDFTDAEISAIEDAVVVASQYGNSVCFTLREGGKCYIPLSTASSVGLGESIDLSKAKLITLGRKGDEDIMRVEI